MIRALLCLSLVVASGPAWALSCLRPSVASSTAQAMSAEDTFRIVVGRFDFDPVEPPTDGPPEETLRRAEFDGRALTGDGFTAATTGEVMLRFGCAGPWCGSLEPGVETLAYLVQEEGAWVLDVEACPRWAFTDPTEAQLETVRACVSGDCPEE